MIILTGANGFIGTNVLFELNKRKIYDIIIVDDKKSINMNNNLPNRRYRLYLDKDELWDWFLREHNELGKISHIIHLGACSDTTETDKKYLYENNFLYSMKLFQIALQNDIQFIYASSAATYGDGKNGFSDDHSEITSLTPLNLYGKSKNDFDIWVLNQSNHPKKWIGLKYFNVFGPYENHKGRMSSVVFHSYMQAISRNNVNLFKSHKPEYLHGDQRRDFIYVEDVAKITVDLTFNKINSGIYNIGMGESNTFNDLAKFLFRSLDMDENITYIDIPLNIRSKYQYNTCAKISKLKKQLPNITFTSFQKGIDKYIKFLSETIVQNSK